MLNLYMPAPRKKSKTMKKVIARFAPSPSGYLHLGHAASAHAAFGFAKRHGGVCLLRIEDIDITRCKREYEQAIYEDLHWLGFDWPKPVLRQSEHFDAYNSVIEDLYARGLVYRCFKTRKELLADMSRAPHGRPPVYFGPKTPLSPKQEGQKRANGEAFAWRLSIEKCKAELGHQYDELTFLNNGKIVKARPERLGDVILGRKDIGTSYHLACCFDDARQGVSDIVRGIDLLESTHIHRLLQALMDWPVPRYHHHGLLVDETGKRLAKRDKAKTLKSLREAGVKRETILAQISNLPPVDV